ncbi:MAG: M56 family metallopeptidase [Muribaculaceae bacterium]|nr:M56 family metallopeptidase [Muribaculaceae bacterium]
MGELLSYSILSGLVLLALYLPYQVLLARDNQHAYNRAILLAIYVLAFAAVPMMKIAEQFTRGSSEPVLALEIGQVVVDATSVDVPVWGTILIWIYMAGMAAVGIKTIVTWVKLVRIVSRGEKIKHSGCMLVLTDCEGLAPFSWMGYVVVSRKDFAESGVQVLAHELGHIRSRHWIDLLVAQAVCVVNWFNPAAWLMRDSLMLVHEYQADNAVLDSGHNAQEYQLLLIKKAVGSRFPSLANSLNHSKLKKRITMMYKKKSGAGRKLKALTLVPMFALALGVAAVPTVRAAISTISSSSAIVGKVSDNSANGEITANNFKFGHIEINDAGDIVIVIIGENLGNNLTVSDCKLTSLGKTSDAKSMECHLTDGSATISAVFPIAAADSGPASLTFTANGKEFTVKFGGGEVEVFEAPEVMPQYPGGETAIMQAVMSKLTFPDPSRTWKPEADGRCVVSFTVYPDGTIGNVRRMKSCGYGDLDQIAIDAVKEALTEKWTPGTVGGKPVAVSYSIPIQFKQK